MIMQPNLKIVGCDPSTYTGLCLFTNGEPTPKLINFKKATGFERLHLIAQSVGSLLDQWAPDVVAIEGYAYGNKYTLVTLTEIGTLIRMEFFKRGIPWYNVPPSTLKLFTTGKGNAKKPDMSAYVLNRWGFTSKNDDIIDAYALARFLEAYLSGGLNTTQSKGVKRYDAK